MRACLICERVALARAGQNAHLIADMRHSVFVVGDHQWHRGYALVLLKEHVREPFELPDDVRNAHFAEVMRAAEALNRTFAPQEDELLVLRQRRATCPLAPRAPLRGRSAPRPGPVARRRTISREDHLTSGSRQHRGADPQQYRLRDVAEGRGLPSAAASDAVSPQHVRHVLEGTGASPARSVALLSCTTSARSRSPRLDPACPAQARRERVGVHAPAHADRRADHRHRARADQRREDRPLQPRALRRRRLPGTASRARRSRSARALSPSATPTTRSSPTGPTAAAARPPRRSASSHAARARSSIRRSSPRSCSPPRASTP